jgi:Cytochrome c554 and c-prime
MADERSAHGRLRPDTVVKNDWVAKAYDQFPVDVLNVSSHDLRYFAETFSKANFARSLQSRPLLGRIVGANTIADSSSFVSPKPYIVREVPSREKGAKAIRVAFVGLTERTPAPPTGFKFTDPAEASRVIVPQARKSADVIVVLAKLSAAEADRVAREAPGIDVIIAGNADSIIDSFTPPHYVGQTLVVFTPFETRMVGELRFYRSAQGKFTTKQRFIALDEALVPDDPAAKQVVEAAMAAESQARRNSIKLLEDWLAFSRTRITERADSKSSSAETSATFVTSSACSQCHTTQYIKWANGPHAHATDPLPPRALEFETSCLDCHASGSMPGTDNKAGAATLQSVHCEQCHGPGSKHIANPGKGYGRIPDMQSACLKCHSAETSPGFDLKAAWERIKH